MTINELIDELYNLKQQGFGDTQIVVTVKNGLCEVNKRINSVKKESFYNKSRLTVRSFISLENPTE
jgi:hypothetical protein